METNKLTVFLTLAFVVSAVSNLLAWDGVVVNGGAGVPLQFVNVVVYDRDSVFVAGTITDENGQYRIDEDTAAISHLRFALIGYEDLCIGRPLPPVIRLCPKVNELNEVVVSADRSAVKLTRGGIKSDVAGTALSQENNALDVIAKMPLVNYDGNEIKVFGKGYPSIYIDGRIIIDQAELERLSASEIKDIEILNNPGARYGGEVLSVINIKTVRKQGDGLGGSVSGSVRQARYLSQSANTMLKYRSGNMDIFGGMSFDNANRYQKQVNSMVIKAADGTYDTNSTIFIKPQSTSYMCNVGLNYQLSIAKSIGFKYQFDATPRNPSHWQTSEVLVVDNSTLDKIDYDTNWKRRQLPVHTLNTYYSGEYGALSVAFNNDLYYSSSHSVQDIQEFSAGQICSEIEGISSIQNIMFASKGVAERKLGSCTYELGYEFTLTDRKDVYENRNDLLPNSDDAIRESTIAVFIGAEISIGDTELDVSVRYEHTSSDYKEYGMRMTEQSRTYDNLFPSIDYSFSLGRADFTLSYSAKTKRPRYSQLSSAIQYDHRFTYETGNPLLKPEITHDISLASIYGKWFFSGSFQHVRRAIVGLVVPYEETGPVNLMTYENFNHVNKYSLVASYSPRIGVWSPRIRLNLMGQSLKIQHMGAMKTLDGPVLFANWNNTLALPKSIFASVDITSRTSGDMDVVRMKPSWQINISLSKSAKGLYVQLQATDIFKTARSSMTTFGTQMVLDKWNYSDTQGLRLTMRYSFNASSDKYKGKPAGDQEKNRL